jgi:hypothetical protein
MLRLVIDLSSRADSEPGPGRYPQQGVPFLEEDVLIDLAEGHEMAHHLLEHGPREASVVVGQVGQSH